MTALAGRDRGEARAAVSPNETMSEAARLLTADDLADRWQIKLSTVYALTRRGEIPTVRLGRLYRYRVEAIEEFERAGGGGSE